MNYLKNSFINTMDFLRSTKEYFRDVLLLHGFIVFIFLPLLGSLTRIILQKNNINYLSYDNLPNLLTQHPLGLLSLLLILLLILTAVYFEFTFLLLSVFFIKKREPISLRQLLRITTGQLRKVRPITILFFLFYFVLLAPITGLNFHSDILSRVKIPAFIMDFIFANRLLIVASFILLYVCLLYLGIRFVFALPEMILRNRPFRLSLKESWQLTRKRFFALIGQGVFIGGTLLLLSSIAISIVLFAQMLFDQYLPNEALVSAVFAMTFLQAIILLNLILSTVGIFYIIVDFMDDEGFLPDIPESFVPEKLKKQRGSLHYSLFFIVTLFFGISVSLYNYAYLTSASTTTPITVSHRGVSEKNGAQNTLPALENTSTTEKPDYVEMDIQETKDKQFIVVHDFNLKNLTGLDKKPQELTLKQLENLTVKENGTSAPLVSFDSYLKEADKLNQKLLIEIKTTDLDSPDLVERFTKKYGQDILNKGHIIQSLTYQTVTDLKRIEPKFYVGYILPFNVVGPPITTADFLTMEYSTINRSFIDSAHSDGKKVFVWTINDSDAINRMMFYGVDGIITDDMTLLNQTIESNTGEITYSDKLLHFVLGVR
ncbi:MAG: glycerophosphoryl diester phosphodiesterase membrane domain-containing protein [Enterococcus sp.]